MPCTGHDVWLREKAAFLNRHVRFTRAGCHARRWREVEDRQPAKPVVGSLGPQLGERSRPAAAAGELQRPGIEMMVPRGRTRDEAAGARRSLAARRMRPRRRRDPGQPSPARRRLVRRLGQTGGPVGSGFGACGRELRGRPFPPPPPPSPFPSPPLPSTFQHREPARQGGCMIWPASREWAARSGLLSVATGHGLRDDAARLARLVEPPAATCAKLAHGRRRRRPLPTPGVARVSKWATAAGPGERPTRLRFRAPSAFTHVRVQGGALERRLAPARSPPETASPAGPRFPADAAVHFRDARAPPRHAPQTPAASGAGMRASPRRRDRDARGRGRRECGDGAPPSALHWPCRRPSISPASRGGRRGAGEPRCRAPGLAVPVVSSVARRPGGGRLG